MVVDRTLYDVLGVDPNATQQTISKAVRTKSLEHHPDRGGSVEMMQKVNAAKEVLTDPSKRKFYDQYGLEGIKSRMGNENFRFEDFPGGSIFDIFNLFNNQSNHRENSRKPRGTDIKHILKVSLEDLYLGSTKTVNIDRDIVCQDCNGIGSNDGIERQCKECKGTGFETSMYRIGPIIQQRQSQCSSCHGQGNSFDKSNRCQKCHGNKIFKENKKFDVNILHGTQNGETIPFLGEANQIPNGEPGNIYFILKQESHPIFQRKNDNLIIKIEINLSESLCGFQRLIKLLDNHQLLINHPPGLPIQPNSFRSIKGYGMYNRNTFSHGDLIIQFNVQFPQNHFITNDNQRKQLESLLPPKSSVKLDNTICYEEVPMMEYDINQQHHHQTDDDDDDNNQFEGQHQGVRCQTQ